MPTLIRKEAALRSASFGREPNDCLICNINARNKYVITEDEHCIVLLSEFPRFWGHVLVCLKKHKEQHSELTAAENAALFGHAHELAKTIEKTLKPSRCYIASLGAEQNLVNTCPHIHINVIPVYDKELKPSAVFTWENGVYTGTETEWNQLQNTLKTGLITL